MNPEPRSQREGGGAPPRRIAVDAEDNAPQGGMLPVWFFVGIIFLVYGIIILVTGLLEIHHPPSTVLAKELHPTIWWGALLTVLGGFYVLRFGPWRG